MNEVIKQMLERKSFAALSAIFIVCSSSGSRTFNAPLRPSIVGRMPILGYPPITLCLAIFSFSFAEI